MTVETSSISDALDILQANKLKKVNPYGTDHYDVEEIEIVYGDIKRLGSMAIISRLEEEDDEIVEDIRPLFNPFAPFKIIKRRSITVDDFSSDTVESEFVYTPLYPQYSVILDMWDINVDIMISHQSWDTMSNRLKYSKECIPGDFRSVQHIDYNPVRIYSDSDISMSIVQRIERRGRSNEFHIYQD